MEKTRFTRLRDLDFSRKLVETAKNRQRYSMPLTREAIIEDTLKCRPESYYMSTDNACVALRRLLKSDYIKLNVVSSNPVRQQFWVDLYKKVYSYRYRHPGTTFDDAVSFVLNFSRPDRFYISQHKAMKLFSKTFTRQPTYVPR